MTKLYSCDRCGDTHMLKDEILCNICQYEVKKKREIITKRLSLPVSGVGLEMMPTIKQGQFSNLKIDLGDFRVYLDRLTYADYDGAKMPPHWPVIFEKLTDKGWRECDANGRIINV